MRNGVRSEAVFVCDGEKMISAGAGEETNFFCQDCDIESDLHCSAREACVGYFSACGVGVREESASVGERDRESGKVQARRGAGCSITRRLRITHPH
jgi:hypothetical protein